VTSSKYPFFGFGLAAPVSQAKPSIIAIKTNEENTSNVKSQISIRKDLELFGLKTSRKIEMTRLNIMKKTSSADTRLCK